MCPPSAGRARGLGRRLLRAHALVGAADLARCAPSARRRATFEQGSTALPLLDRADSGPLAAFSSLRSVGMAGRPIPPRSSRRNAPRGPNSSRSRNLRCAPVSRGPVQSCYPRGRRGGCAVATGLCCGPRDEALRNSATPTGGSEGRMQIGDGKFEIRNSKFEIQSRMVFDSGLPWPHEGLHANRRRR